jgi:hypothetical protein
MSDELFVIDPCEKSSGPTYELYRDGHLVIAWGSEFHNALMNHPLIKAAYGEKIELNGVNDER